MNFKIGDKAVLKSQVHEGKFYDVVVIGEPVEGKSELLVRVKSKEMKMDELQVLVSRLRHFSPLDEALS